MSSTDNRVVKMQFDNKTFMKNAADTSKALSDVNKSVDGAGKGKGLLDLSNQMSQVGVTASKMQVVTTTALATIANKATNVALGLAKSLTFDPIMQGFTEYESLLTKQNTIMNATGLSAQRVKGYLNDLNVYSDQTIYSFGNMTESITKFVNAGVPLGAAVDTVKGIANAAAYAGASTEDANRAMFAFSQSISNGFLTLGDFNQIETANMATVQFKQTLLDSAVAAGTLTKEGKKYITSSGKAITATQGFQYSLQEQWATTEVLNTALGKYSDTSTKLGRKAAESATEVRTFTAFMSTLKESIGSGWSQIFTALIGNLDQATSFWTGFSTAIGESVGQFFNFISIALRTWRQMGGFEKTMQGFKNILAPFGALLGAIGDAWAKAFPSSNSGAGKALYGLSAGFELITRPLAWLAKGIPAITPVLTGFFLAIKTGVGFVKGSVQYIVDFVQAAISLSEIDAPNAGGFLGFVQGIVTVVKEAARQIQNLISKGQSLGGAISSSLGSISLPSISLPDMPDMPKGPDTSGAGDAAAKAASGAADAAREGASKMKAALDVLLNISAKMGDVLGNLYDRFKTFISGIDMTDVVQAFNIGVFTTFTLALSRLIWNLGGAVRAFDKMAIISDILDQTGAAVKAFQMQARAKLILNIAIALALLAASLWLLSKIPGDKLAMALGAMAGLGAILSGVLLAFSKVVDKMDKKGTAGKTLALSVTLIALGVAILLLAGAMLIMNRVDWSSLVKGLVTMGALLGVMYIIGDLGENAAKNLLAGAFAIGVMAGSMILLAGALLLFKLIDWKDMAKAGAALGGLAFAIGILAKVSSGPQGAAALAAAGGAFLLASTGMIALANALLIFQLVQWESIGKAGVALIGLAAGLALMVLGAGAGPGMLLAAIGLNALAIALLIFEKVDYGSIMKMVVAMGALGLGLLILAPALYLASPGLLMFAGAIALLGVGLLAFTTAMALAIAISAAGAAAFAVLGVGAATAIAVFIQTLALQAPVMKESLLTILKTAIDTIVESVPMVVNGFRRLFRAIMVELQSGDKKQSFGEIAEKWLDKLIKTAETFIPKLTRLGVEVVLGILRGIRPKAGELAAAGVELVVAFIRGVTSRIDRVVSAAVDLIIEFARGIGKQGPKLLAEGVNLIAGFLHDLASTIRGGSGAIGAGIVDVVDAFRDVGMNMVRGLAGGVRDFAQEALDEIGDMVNDAIALANKLPGINSPSRVFMVIGKFMALGLAKGIQNHAAAAIVSVASMITGAIAVSEDYMSRYFQRLDQQALAARGRAQGLADAAAKARASAKRTKDREDDQAARVLSRQARRAAKTATAEVNEARKAREAAAAREKWEKANNAQRAEMRAGQAQSQLAGAKEAQRAAEAARVSAQALREQARKAGSPEERKKLLAMARKQQKEAREQAERANQLLNGARASSADAIRYQGLAAKDAAATYQANFDKEAKAAADAAAFEKLTDAEKADIRRKEAIALEAKSKATLAEAKLKAKTDLAAGNALATRAIEEANLARQKMKEAEDFANANGGPAKVIDLYQTDSAAQAFNDYKDLYDSATAAAAAGARLEFNQYNTSPESLSDAEIYRQTNNQLTFAADKLQGVA